MKLQHVQIMKKIKYNKTNIIFNYKKEVKRKNKSVTKDYYQY